MSPSGFAPQMGQPSHASHFGTGSFFAVGCHWIDSRPFDIIGCHLPTVHQRMQFTALIPSGFLRKPFEPRAVAEHLLELGVPALDVER